MRRFSGFQKLHKWLSSEISESGDKRYRHQLIKEKTEDRCEVLNELSGFVQDAHDDTRRYLREAVSESLDPLEQTDEYDPADGYPERLNINDLKAYFGEVFAGIIAENFSPFNHNWKVPAFLFRFHNVAFQRLEKIHQIGGEAEKVPGRTGDDCLAFERAEEGRIIRSLFCEAKCTNDHNSDLISDAHIKLSETNIKPVDIIRLIQILRDYNDPESSQWVDSLRQLLNRKHFELSKPGSNYERCDLLSYVCGRSPIRQNTWISTDRPHERYEGGRRLEAVEIHLSNVEKLVREVYNKRD